MNEPEQGKLCPACDSDELRQFDEGAGVLCINCGMVGPSIGCNPIESWNAMPRREEFHAKMGALKRGIEILRTRDCSDMNPNDILELVTTKLNYMIEEYALAKPGKKENDNERD